MHKRFTLLLALLFLVKISAGFGYSGESTQVIYTQLKTFENLSSKDILELKRLGFSHVECVKPKFYFAHFEGTRAALSKVEFFKLESISKQDISFKCQENILRKEFPNWAIIEGGKVKISIRWQFGIDVVTALSNLEKRYNLLNSSEHKISALHSHVWVATNQLTLLAEEPSIRYLSVAIPNDVTLNYIAQGMMSVGYASFDYSLGGRGLRGDSLVVGVGDNADVQLHVDLIDRLLNFSNGYIINHGYHTTGSLAGAGLIQPKFRGVLPKATIISTQFSNILYNTPLYKSLYNMTITNNSYGAMVGNCDYAGIYDELAQSTDELILEHPEVIHVFAAGNDGGLLCPNIGKGFKSILGGYQASKNAITVANILFTDKKNKGSSQGPLKCDNRLKPDVATLGNGVNSTVPGDGYGPDWGTSMASPSVAGVAGLIMQRYKQLNNGNLPQSDLIKTLLLNGAYDIGIKGPDVSFGYGRVSAERSIQMLEKNNYKIDSIAQGDSIVYLIPISNNTTQAKYMLYYHDLPANPFCDACLMNNLDFYVIDPNGDIHLPYVIDPTDSVTTIQPAFKSRDSINNTEQVEINYGVSGTYKVVVKGTSILNGKQRFVLAFDTLQPKVFLRSPIGGERLISGSTEVLLWDLYDTAKVTYNLSYSKDNGTSWISIATGLHDSLHHYAWTPPAADSNGFRLKVTTSNGHEAISGVFSCMPLAVLTISPVANQCPTFARVTWNPIAGIKDYLVLQKIGAEMKIIDSTTNASYIYKNLDANTKYYFAVQPRKGSLLGQQSTAKWYTPNAGSCILVNYNHDLRIDTILFPNVGRKNTSTQFSNLENIRVVYSNQGNTTTTNYSLSYSINGGSVVTQSFTDSLVAHSKDTLILPIDLSQVQTHTLKLAITNQQFSDINTFNDTLFTTIRHLPNEIIDLVTPFHDGFETSLDTMAFTKNGSGILSSTRWDFSASSPQGRVRTKVLPNFSLNGNYAATLDNNLNTNTINTDTLLATFNLSTYQADTNDIRLGFFFKHHNVENFDIDNAVYLRGNDTSNWIKVYDLLQNQSINAGEFKEVKSLQVSRLLNQNGQVLSSSTQIKFTHTGKYKCIDYLSANGLTIDDIKLYKVRNDVNLVSIEPIKNRTCGLNNNMPIKINIQNTTKNSIQNIVAGYSLDGQNYVTETISNLPADSTVTYTFNTKANLSGLGNHNLSVYVFHAPDSYRANDSILNSSIFNYPLISQFPYLENFESNNGFYKSEGANNSWAYGKPNQSMKINRAASGDNVWKTNLNGTYKSNEKSYLYTPCFDINNLNNPMISFSLAYQIESCGNSLCDGAFIDYSFDGLLWKRLDYDTTLVKSWYIDTLFAVWNGSQTNWKGYSFTLPKDTFGNAIQLRFGLQSDPGLEQEGIAIDDIHVYDLKNEIYNDTLNSSTITQTINVNTLVEFIDKNQLFAGIQILGNDELKDCKLNVYINNDSLRFPYSNYFLNRNITVKPMSKNTNDSVNVRIYFTQDDVDDVIQDTNCITCNKPRDAYDFGITKFSSVEDEIENGNLSDNTPGILTHEPEVTISPYHLGYYAEMKVKHFSEFWLSYSPKISSTLTMKLKNFEARNVNDKQSLITWQTESEVNNHHFEVERAVGNVNFQNNNYQKIGTINSKGNNPQNDYNFADENIPNFSEVYYYRIKWINNGGEFGYTETLPVVFGNEMPWLLYPNPSSDPFVQFQINEGQKIDFFITDVTGKKVHSESIMGNGFIQKANLNTDGLANGIYIVKIMSKNRYMLFNWLKR